MDASFSSTALKICLVSSGVLQESKAEKAIEALQEIAAATTTAIMQVLPVIVRY